MKRKVFYGRHLSVACGLLLIASLVLAFTGCPGDNPPPAPVELIGTVTITGDAQVTKTLTANTTQLGGDGTISYQWQRATDTDGTDAEDIGTNANTYTLVDDDEDMYIGVTVTRAGNTGSITSDWKGPIIAESATLPTVSHVTVSASHTRVDPGETVQFAATVHGDNSPSQNVTWTIVTLHVAETVLDHEGLLSIDENETATSVTVRATSTFDPTKYSEATVLINSVVAVSSVSISPANISVGKGKSTLFVANVTGLGNYERDVDWSMEATIPAEVLTAGTTLVNGFLTIDENETATSITVTATSTADATKFGTATVTIPITITPLTGIVTITGYEQVGMTLAVDTSNLLGEGTISYQWKRADTSIIGTAIENATNSTYTPVAEDEGKYISVTVTRSGNSGEKDAKTDDAVRPVPASTGGIDGTVTVESGIEEVNVSFDNANGFTLSGTATVTVDGSYQSYRWFVDGLELAEERGTSLVLQASDYAAGSHRILVIVYRDGIPYSHEIRFIR